MKQSTLGSFIRSLRMQNQMTQAQLAEKLGVTDKAVSKWERDLSYPDITVFPSLADTLGVTVDDLMNEFSEEGQPSRLLQIFEMSHDIRTPLHIILGCVNMLEIYHGDEQLLRRYLESIRISGEYLLQSFDRIMAVTRQEPENIAGSIYPADVRELGECLEKQAGEKKVKQRNYDFTGKCILVAEDIGMNREIAAGILSQTGAEVALAENGRICLELVEQSPAGTYDLILMDILMPEMDGLEATRRIRALPEPEKASLPVIALSANVHEKDRQAAEEAGMNDFVKKPIFVDPLLEVLSRYLGGDVEKGQ